MSKTKSGRRHDKRIVDKFQLARHIPRLMSLFGQTHGRKACKNRILTL
ncbi:MAG: hypothetical protein ABIC82_02515 [bacterium]